MTTCRILFAVFFFGIIALTTNDNRSAKKVVKRQLANACSKRFSSGNRA